MTGLIRRNNFAPRAPSRNEFLTPFDRVFDDMFSNMFPTFSRDFGEDFFVKGSYPKVNVVNFDDCIDKMNITEKLEKWRSLSSSLNQITRSLGMQDAYPFTLGKKVSEKIACVSKFIAWICQDNAIEMQ